MSKTLIGVVSYGGLPFLKLLLNEVCDTLTRPADLAVVVAKPNDEEMWTWLHDWWKSVAHSSRGLLSMRHEKNNGFPASVNDLYETAFVRSDYDNLIICGNDIVPMPGAVDAMIKCAETTDYEMVCGSEFNSKFLYDHYPEVRNYFQGPNLVVTEEGLNSRIWEIHKDFRSGIEPDTRKDIRNFTLFKRSAFEKSGYADVNFFPNGYWEDCDACLRMNKSGVSSCGLMEAAFYHWWSRTIHQGESRPHGVFFQRNQEMYLHKWGGLWGDEKYTLPFDGRGFQLSPDIFLAPDVKIANRDQEQKIIEYWSSL